MACPFYRERWIGDGEFSEGRTVLYHVICLQNTPPATIDQHVNGVSTTAACMEDDPIPNADACQPSTLGN